LIVIDVVIFGIVERNALEQPLHVLQRHDADAALPTSPSESA
jgi:hypothetical protein